MNNQKDSIKINKIIKINIILLLNLSDPNKKIN